METPKTNSREFILVIVMLGVLTLLVAFILFTPITPSPLPYKTGNTIDSVAYKNYLEDSKMYYQSNLEYKKNLLAIILTAFGAWVGAGAAYFFGRENLRESAQSLLQLHQQMTGYAKLGQIKVRDIPPKPLDSNFAETTTLKDLLAEFTSNPHKWFVSVNTTGKWIILSKEGIFQYIQKQSDSFAKKDATKTYTAISDELMKQTLKDIVPVIQQDAQLAQFANKFVEANLDDNASTVNNEMDVKGIFLGIVKDETGNFVQYFTTSDIRKALLKI